MVWASHLKVNVTGSTQPFDQDLYWYDRLNLTNAASFQASQDYHEARRTNADDSVNMNHTYSYCWVTEALDLGHMPHSSSVSIEHFSNVFSAEPEDIEGNLINAIGDIPASFRTSGDREIQMMYFNLDIEALRAPFASYVGQTSYSGGEFYGLWFNASPSLRQTVKDWWGINGIQTYTWVRLNPDGTMSNITRTETVNPTRDATYLEELIADHLDYQ